MTGPISHRTALVQATHDAMFTPRWQSAVLDCLNAGESRQTVLDLIHRATDYAVDFVISARAGMPPAPPAPHKPTRKYKGKPS
jgi:hypothetical protein